MGKAVDLRSLFPSRDSEVEGPDADVSDSSSDDAADPQLDIPDAHLGEQSTKTIFSVSSYPRMIVCLLIAPQPSSFLIIFRAVLCCQRVTFCSAVRLESANEPAFLSQVPSAIAHAVVHQDQAHTQLTG